MSRKFTPEERAQNLDAVEALMDGEPIEVEITIINLSRWVETPIFRHNCLHRRKIKKLETSPVWRLPDPPEGFKWHRVDWSPDMLPRGSRPLLLGEMPQPGDQCVCSTGTIVSPSDEARAKSHVHTRTTRDLPEECRKSARVESSAKMIPWTLKTCPRLPFEVVPLHVDTYRTTVLWADSQGCQISGEVGKLFRTSWDELFRDYSLPDKSPCGELSL